MGSPSRYRILTPILRSCPGSEASSQSQGPCPSPGVLVLVPRPHPSPRVPIPVPSPRPGSEAPSQSPVPIPSQGPHPSPQSPSWFQGPIPVSSPHPSPQSPSWFRGPIPVPGSPSQSPVPILVPRPHPSPQSPSWFQGPIPVSSPHPSPQSPSWFRGPIPVPGSPSQSPVPILVPRPHPSPQSPSWFQGLIPVPGSPSQSQGPHPSPGSPSRFRGPRPIQVAPVVTDVQVLSDRSPHPSGYTRAPEFPEPRAAVSRKKRIYVRLQPREAAATAVFDVQLSAKSSALPLYMKIGEIGGFALWCKKGPLSEPLSLQQLSLRAPASPQGAPAAPTSPKRAPGALHDAGSIYGLSAMDGVPFALHPRFESRLGPSSTALLTDLTVKSLADIEREYHYAFVVERTAAARLPPSVC
ncbi:multivesicular body subunit 12A isoform X2 [Phaenicophaeus curvirostris]|uniref:multivesicular body subunit 12A isoform X2 n=1 Tax=Phaenicophaeus curvirostris TaxID=33595 RepID=UPI0037F0CE46